jgi:hypothetical protein
MPLSEAMILLVPFSGHSCFYFAFQAQRKNQDKTAKWAEVCPMESLSRENQPKLILPWRDFWII